MKNKDTNPSPTKSDIRPDASCSISPEERITAPLVVAELAASRIRDASKVIGQSILDAASLADPNRTPPNKT